MWRYVGAVSLTSFRQLQASVAALSQRIKDMSDTVGAEIATIQAGVSKIATDLTTIQALVASLKSSQTTGFSAADQAALDTLASSVASAMATADSIASPPAGSPPPA